MFSFLQGDGQLSREPIDLASTNGTIIDGIATPVAKLGPEAMIDLAEGNRVFWHML